MAQVKPAWVVACYGINDGIYHPFSEKRLAAYQAGVEKLITKVNASGARLILLTAPPYAKPGPRSPKEPMPPPGKNSSPKRTPRRRRKRRKTPTSLAIERPTPITMK